MSGAAVLTASCSFNTQPPEGGWLESWIGKSGSEEFQHTAARRRLDPNTVKQMSSFLFQHTAARRRLAKIATKAQTASGFNTQPPEGGWAG